MHEIDLKELQSKIDVAVEWVLKSSYPVQEKVLIILLLRNGLRVSDICTPSNFRFINQYKALLLSKKNNQWREVTTAEAYELIEQYNLIDSLQYWQRNRFYYYRMLKGLITDVETSRTGNTAVTHAARNIAAQSAFELTKSDEAAKIAIGNRSKSATKAYLTKGQKKASLKSGIIGDFTGVVGSVKSPKHKPKMQIIK